MAATVSPYIPEGNPFFRPSTIARQPFRFLDLPYELRVKIYEEVLVIGKIFFSPSFFELEKVQRYKDAKCYALPQVQFLRVCREIHHESEKIYLSQNLFILPPGWPLYAPFRGKYSFMRHNLPKDRHLFSEAGLKYIKNVNVTFDSEVVGYQALTLQLRSMEQRRQSQLFDHLSNEERTVLYHAFNYEYRKNCWKIMTDTLRFFQNGLRSLEMDFVDACCGNGCCRYVLDRFKFLDNISPTKTSFIGLMDGEEAALVKSAANKLGLPEDVVEEKFGLEFNPVEDPWAVWQVEEGTTNGQVAATLTSTEHQDQEGDE